MQEILIGTCSWNYESWVDLVYSRKQRYAHLYLEEYARRFRTGEIDSWFYKLPDPEEAGKYLSLVDPGFNFTCKVWEGITLTHARGGREKNPGFLSRELFLEFWNRIRAMEGRLGALIFEFEYLNADKMSGVGEFIDRFGAFREALPAELPVAVEIRNKNWVGTELFRFFADHRIIPVLSEKEFMPPVWQTWEKHRGLIGDALVLRLMGGNRQEIEAVTGNKWNQVVAEKPDLPRIAKMSIDAKYDGKRVIININNHYEGSAPITVGKLEGLLGQLESERQDQVPGAP